METKDRDDSERSSGVVWCGVEFVYVIVGRVASSLVVVVTLLYYMFVPYLCVVVALSFCRSLSLTMLPGDRE